MPFNFEPKLKKPGEYDKSAARAAVDEARQFTSARRKFNYRKLMGLEPDEEPQGSDAEPEATGDMPPEECQACQEGNCEDPMHPKEGDADSLASLEITLKKRKPEQANDHDFDE